MARAVRARPAPLPRPPAMASTVTANTANRLSTSIVGIAPSNEALRRPSHRAASPSRCRRPIERSIRQGRSSSTGFLGARAAGPEGNPGFSNHNSGPSQCTPHIFHATKGRQIDRSRGRLFVPFSATMPLFYLSLTRQSDHGPRRLDSTRLGRNRARRRTFGARTRWVHSAQECCFTRRRPLLAVGRHGLGGRHGRFAAARAAQGAVKSVHNDWQVRCDTPPGAQGEHAR